jgi:N-acetylglucosamine-6-phosphate deacetylase
VRLVISGADLFVDGELRRGDLVAQDGVITHVGSDAASSDWDPRPDDEVMDGSGVVVAPGFIDLQCNGAVGVDITTDPRSIPSVARALPRFGVTSFLPTVVTSPAANRTAAIAALPSVRAEVAGAAEPGADPLGLHFEGPMISPRHLGAHPAHLVGPVDGAELDTWIASGTVALVTLAPELPGALDVVSRLVDGGIVVSAGHTGMTPDDFDAARFAGVSYTTHLFNAMAPFGHRAPGPIGAVLADDALVAGLICDGVHVDPVAVRMAWRALGPHRTSLVSDAVGALGVPHGRIRLAGFEVVHDESGVRTVDGVLAGSALALDQAMRNLVAFTGCTLIEALPTVTSTPADLLGLTDRGRLRPGLRADLTIVDPDGNLVATIVGGRLAHDARVP